MAGSGKRASDIGPYIVAKTGLPAGTITGSAVSAVVVVHPDRVAAASPALPIMKPRRVKVFGFN